MDFIYTAFAVPLQALLVVLLLRGALRDYLIVFIYAVVYLLTSILEAIVIQLGGKHTALYHSVYWTDEIVLDLLLFLMVILLTLQATRESPMRAGIAKALSVIVLIALVLPFVAGSRPYFTVRWFQLTGQILNFGGALMNLGLWTALIGSRRKNPQLLAVSTGVGVAVTGQAIYYGLRLITTYPVVRGISDVINLVTYIGALGIWCWAFRPKPKARVAEQPRIATDP